MLKKHKSNLITTTVNKKSKLRTAKGRKLSSTKWLNRHINDPYVALAKQRGYRSRAAFKLIEIDDCFNFISKASSCIVDLGSSPGSWLQVILERKQYKTHLIGIDLTQIKTIEGIKFFCRDFMNTDVAQELQHIIINLCTANLHTNRKIENSKPLSTTHVDLVLSDLAPFTSGFKDNDQIRMIDLAKNALYFAKQNLKIGGNFITKIFTCNQQQDLVNEMNSCFKKTKLFKPKASYSNSTEIFIVAQNFFI